MDNDMRHVLARLDLYVSTMDEPMEQVEFLSEVQRVAASGLWGAVDAARRAGATWATLADATGLSGPTVFRQHAGGGPVVVVRARHGRALPPGSLRLPDGWIQDSLFDLTEMAA